MDLLEHASLSSHKDRETRTLVFERQAVGTSSFIADRDYHIVQVVSGSGAGFVLSFDSSILATDISNLNQCDVRLIASGTSAALIFNMNVPFPSGKYLYCNGAATARINVVLAFD